MKANPLFGAHPNVAGRRRFEVLVDAVTRAINEADPKSLLQLGAPADEYSAEVGTVVPRVARAASPKEVRSILHEEFERWFGEGSVGPPEAFDVSANAIWEAVLAFRETV